MDRIGKGFFLGCAAPIPGIELWPGLSKSEANQVNQPVRNRVACRGSSLGFGIY